MIGYFFQSISINWLLTWLNNLSRENEIISAKVIYLVVLAFQSTFGVFWFSQNMLNDA